MRMTAGASGSNRIGNIALIEETQRLGREGGNPARPVEERTVQVENHKIHR